MSNPPPARRRRGPRRPAVTSSTTDEEVWQLSLERPEQFAVIFDRHWPAIRRYCVARAGRVGGEDVASETFRVAFDSRHRFDPERGVLRGWMFGIAANLLRRHARDHRRLHLAPLRDEPSIPGLDDVEARVDARAVAVTLRAALDRLRPEEREVIELVAWTHLTYSEIAQALDIPIGTVRSRIARGRERLALYLKPTTTEDDDRAPVLGMRGIA